MKAVPRIELCAGNKIKIVPSLHYVKYTNGTLAKLDPHSLEKTNGKSEKKAEYYLGKITQLNLLFHI